VEKNINRLMIKFEQLLRTENREKINPKIEELCINDLRPIVSIVARCRADYLEHLYVLSKKYEDSDDVPSSEELQKLRAFRLRFEELSEGAKALEVCIQRGYLDLKDDAPAQP
jgi:hypothetical protein